MVKEVDENFGMIKKMVNDVVNELGKVFDVIDIVMVVILMVEKIV